MKKGLLLTLALVTIALLCTSAYGSTINISDIKDILIGDAEQNTTIDNNFFIFTSVFNMDDMVSFSPTDYPSSDVLVKWSFLEYEDEADWSADPPVLAAENWITINDIEQNPGSIWSPGAYNLRTKAQADFRHIGISDPADEPMPFDPPTSALLEPRYLDLIATFGGSGGTSDTESIIVYPWDDGNDGFTPPFVYQDNFDSANTWTWSDLATYYPLEFPASTSSYVETATGNGDYALGFASADTTADMNGYTEGSGFMNYGTWQSPLSPMPISYNSGKLYNARWHLVSNQSTAIDQPGWRVRTMSGHGAQSAVLHHVNVDNMTEQPAAISTDANNPTIYNSYFYPAPWIQDYVENNIPAQGGLYLAMDMTDGRPLATGKISVSEVDVAEIDPPAATTPLYSSPTFTAADWSVSEWDAYPAPGTSTPTTVVTGIDTANGLTATFNARTAVGFRMALFSNYARGSVSADKLYRLTVGLKSTGTILPTMRLRVFTTLGDQACEVSLTPAGIDGSVKDYALPGSTEQEMVAYLPIETFKSGDQINLSCDFYSVVDLVNDHYVGTYNVTSVKLEELDL